MIDAHNKNKPSNQKTSNFLVQPSTAPTFNDGGGSSGRSYHQRSGGSPRCETSS